MKKTSDFEPRLSDCNVCPFLADIAVVEDSHRRANRFARTLRRLFGGTLPIIRESHQEQQIRTTRVSCAPTTDEQGRCMKNRLFIAQGIVDGAAPGGFDIKGYPNQRCIRD